MKKVLLAVLLAGVTLSATAAQTIRFATEASYPPFESIDANNKIVGFDVDLANALCKEIDATCTFTTQAFARSTSKPTILLLASIDSNGG